jgi:hypothetical protein
LPQYRSICYGGRAAGWAALGLCNPYDESRCTDGTSEQAIRTDARSQAQRNQDTLKATTANNIRRRRSGSTSPQGNILAAVVRSGDRLSQTVLLPQEK